MQLGHSKNNCIQAVALEINKSKTIITFRPQKYRTKRYKSFKKNVLTINKHRIPEVINEYLHLFLVKNDEKNSRYNY